MCAMVADNFKILVDEFLDYWTASVDPSALSLPPTFLDNLCKNKVMNKRPLTRYALVLSQARTPPAPNVCAFISTNDIMTLEKTPFVLEIMEKTLDRLQSEWRPILEKHTSPGHWEVMTLVRALQVLVGRAALGKQT